MLPCGKHGPVRYGIMSQLPLESLGGIPILHPLRGSTLSNRSAAKAKPKDPAPASPTAFECRFCRNPLAPDGEFCETCGAPVEEAATPGFVKPKPKPTPAPPENLSTAPAPAPSIPDAKPKASGQVSPGPRKKERARQRARSDAPARAAPPSPPKPRRQASPPVRRTATPPPQPATTRKPGKPANWVSSALSLLLVVVAVGATAWYLHRSTSETPDTGTDLLTPAASPQSARRPLPARPESLGRATVVTAPARRPNPPPPNHGLCESPDLQASPRRPIPRGNTQSRSMRAPLPIRSRSWHGMRTTRMPNQFLKTACRAESTSRNKP